MVFFCFTAAAFSGCLVYVFVIMMLASKYCTVHIFGHQVDIGWLGFVAVTSGCLAAVLFGRLVSHSLIVNHC